MISREEVLIAFLFVWAAAGVILIAGHVLYAIAEIGGGG